MLAITFAGSIPLNDELATYQALTPEDAAQARSDFEDRWNALNLWRTAASVGSFACLVAALAWPRRDD